MSSENARAMQPAPQRRSWVRPIPPLVGLGMLLVAAIVAGVLVYVLRKKNRDKNTDDQAPGASSGGKTEAQEGTNFPTEAPWNNAPEPGIQPFDNSPALAALPKPQAYPGPAMPTASEAMKKGRALKLMESRETGTTELGIPTLKKIPQEPQDLPPGYASSRATTSKFNEDTSDRAVGTNGQVYAVAQAKTCSALEQHSLIDMILDSCESYCGHDNQCIAFSFNYDNGQCTTYADCPAFKDSKESARVFVKMPSRIRN